MKDYAVPIIVALLGLLGTLAGIAVAYRQWRFEKRKEGLKSFLEERQKTYREIWERTEQLNLETRLDKMLKAEFTERIAAINSFMMKANIFVDDEDRELVNSYIREM